MLRVATNQVLPLPHAAQKEGDRRLWLDSLMDGLNSWLAIQRADKKRTPICTFDFGLGSWCPGTPASRRIHQFPPYPLYPTKTTNSNYLVYGVAEACSE